MVMTPARALEVVLVVFPKAVRMVTDLSPGAVIVADPSPGPPTKEAVVVTATSPRPTRTPSQKLRLQAALPATGNFLPLGTTADGGPVNMTLSGTASRIL